MHNNWRSIIGHEWAVQLLTSGIQHQRVGHAYLITGLEHVGKTTLARTFAQALNCQASSLAQQPCGQCRACKLIAADRHPDIRLVEPEVSDRGKPTLKIEPVRALQHDLNLAAYEALYKVAILKNFDAATSSAANAFLKTLEEPPNNVILILTAQDSDTLLPTITSRCRTIALRPISNIQIKETLHTRWHVPEDEAHLLAHLADGRLGWAVQAHRNPAILEARQDHLEQLYEAIIGNRVDRFNIAEKLSRKPEILPDILKYWLSWWRDVTLLAHQQTQDKYPNISVTNIDQKDYLERIARSWKQKRIVTSFKQTNLALWQLQRNANTRLVLEGLLLTYPFQM